jgi:hypothetical protein
MIKSNARQRKQMLRDVDDSFIQSICECCYNVVKGNVTIDPAKLKKVFKYRKQIRAMADRKVALVKKHRMVQKGGFLGPLFALIAPLIGGLVSSFSK